MASGPISWKWWGNSGNISTFFAQNHRSSDCSHELKTFHLLEKATNLDNILKAAYFLPTSLHLAKAMVFSSADRVEQWRRIDAWCGIPESPLTASETVHLPGVYWSDWCHKPSIFARLRIDHRKRLWYWGITQSDEGDDQRWHSMDRGRDLGAAMDRAHSVRQIHGLVIDINWAVEVNPVRKSL